MATMDTNKKIREQISAFCDGELAMAAADIQSAADVAADVELTFAGLGTPEGRQLWAVYHQIGDVLRSQASPDLSPGFSERLAARLASEPMPARRTAGAAPAAEAKPVVAAATRS